MVQSQGHCLLTIRAQGIGSSNGLLIFALQFFISGSPWRQGADVLCGQAGARGRGERRHPRVQLRQAGTLPHQAPRNQGIAASTYCVFVAILIGHSRLFEIYNADWAKGPIFAELRIYHKSSLNAVQPKG